MCTHNLKVLFRNIKINIFQLSWNVHLYINYGVFLLYFLFFLSLPSSLWYKSLFSLSKIWNIIHNANIYTNLTKPSKTALGRLGSVWAFDPNLVRVFTVSMKKYCTLSCRFSPAISAWSITRLIKTSYNINYSNVFLFVFFSTGFQCSFKCCFYSFLLCIFSENQESESKWSAVQINR